MKLSAARIEPFLNSPDENITGVLVFGPEQGLVNERVGRLVAAVAGVPADPFRTSTLSAQHIKSDPARLVDEAASLTLMGGRRVVRVRDAADTLNDAFARVLGAQQSAALVIAEAGDLPKRSKLRRLFEGAANAVAIACYEDNEASVRTLIEQTLQAHSHTISHEATDVLISHLGSNRAVTRSELNKLSLYKDAAGEIGLDDVLAIISDSSAISLGGIAYTACRGDSRALAHALDTAFSEGLQPVPVLRTVANHLFRLLQATELVGKGRTVKQAMQALRPPVIFRLEDSFREQMQTWPRERLGSALSLITQAELDCKQTGAPARAICSRALMQLSQAANSQATRRGRPASRGHSAPLNAASASRGTS